MTKFASFIEATPAFVSQVTPANDFDYCAFECGYEELALASTVSDDDFKNDTSSFLFRKVTPNDTLAFELVKNGVKVADLDDDTYGTFYPSFDNQPLQTGFIINWKNVLTLNGFGKYTFRTIINSLGNETTQDSRCFKLIPYNDEIADKTVKIKTFQLGNIIGSNVDYTDILTDGWPNAYRVRGQFKKVSYEFISERYETQRYEKQQIRDQIKTIFELQINSFPALILNIFTYDSLLADTLEITDYNIYNTEIFRNLPVSLINVGELKKQNKDRLLNFTCEFELKTENQIKRPN